MNQEIDYQVLIDFIREEFEKEIKIKTGWGKNEIMYAHDKAMVRALIRFMAKFFPGSVT